VDEQSSPFLVLHGAMDTNVPVEHARRIVAALQDAGVEVIYGQFPQMDHFDIADWGFNGPWALAFLARHLDPGA
jgi:dipeptidyl aminopeptidase/acylaminoacyl peptidase